MFEYDGQQYTQAQVEDAAKKRDMTLSDYVSKFGIKQIVEQESPGKQKPTAEGAAVEKQEAPKSTESNSVNTSSASQDPIKQPKYVKKGVVLTKDQLEATTGFGKDLEFGDSYQITGPDNYKQVFTKSEIKKTATEYGMTVKNYLNSLVNNPNYGVTLIPGGQTEVQTLNEAVVWSQMDDRIRPIYAETKKDLDALDKQAEQKKQEFLELGYDENQASQKAQEFKIQRTEEVLQLKNRKLESPRDREILSNLLKKPEDFSVEEINQGIKMMSNTIKEEMDTKMEAFNAFLKSGDQSQAEYWKNWAEDFDKKVNEYNKSIKTMNDAAAVSVFNKTISDQAFKDYDLLSRVDYSFTEFTSQALMPFVSDKTVLANQKMLDKQKEKLSKAISVDDSKAEGLVLRSYAEDLADNSASTIGSILMYMAPGGQAIAPVVFGLSAAGQRRSSLLQQQKQGVYTKAYLKDQLKSAKGKAAEDIKQEIQAIDNILDLTSSDIYLTGLTTGAIEGSVTAIAGKLGSKGINAIPGLRNALGKNVVARNILGKLQTSKIAETVGKAATIAPAEVLEESTIAGLDNELVDGLILGNRSELSEVYNKEFFRSVIVNSLGTAGGVKAGSTIVKLPLLVNNLKSKRENKKLLETLINEKQKLRNFDTTEELSEQDKEYRNNILKTISETAEKLNINQQNQVINVENLTDQEIKALYRAQAEKASIRTKVSELNAEAVKQGKKLEDLIDRESLRQLQSKYDAAEASITSITNPLSEEKSKDLSIEQQYDLERSMYNLALAKSKGDTFVLGENLAEEVLLSELQSLSKNENNLSEEELENKRLKLKDSLKGSLSRNSSFNELPINKQKAVLDFIESNAGFELEMANSNGQYIKGTGVKFVNMPLIEATITSDKVGRIEKVSAIESPVHETLHNYTDYNKISNSALINAGVELKKRLESKYENLSEEDVKEIKRRINYYEKSNNKAQFYEELMNLYNDLNRAGIINDSEIDNSYSLSGLVKEVRSSVFGAISKAGLSGETGLDVISHIRGFNRFLNSKKQAKIDLDKQVDTDTTSSMSSKNLSDIKQSLDEIVSNQDGTKKFNTKEEFKSSDAVNKVRTLIETTNLLDGSIRNLATRYGAKSVDVKAVKDIISDRVANNFDPALNESLFGYILGKNGILNFAYRDYVNNQNKQVESESIDIEQGEVGFVGQVFDEYVDEYDEFESMDISIGARKKEVVESQLIEPAYTFGQDIGEEVDKQAENFINENDLSNVSMKSTPMLGLEAVAKKLLLRPNVIFDKKLNLNSNEVNSISKFIYDNVEDIIRILPDAFVEEGVSQKYVGTSTGIPNNLLKLFYISTNDVDADSSDRIGKNGLYPWLLKGELQKLGKPGSKISEEAKNEVLIGFGIMPDGSLKESGLGRKSEGQSMKGLIGLMLKLGSNTAIRKAAIEKGGYDQITIEDAGAGKSFAMASIGSSDAQIEIEHKKFKISMNAKAKDIAEALNSELSESGFDFTEEEILNAIEEGFLADSALGAQTFVAERIIKIKTLLEELSKGIDPSFLSIKSYVISYLGLHHRTALLDFSRIKELSGKGEIGDLYKKSIQENGEKVKSITRVRQILPNKDSFYKKIAQKKTPTWVSKETRSKFKKVKSPGNLYTYSTADKLIGLSVEDARKKALTQDVENNNKRKYMLRALDNLVLDFYKHMLKSSSKQDALDAVSLVSFMTQATSNASNGRRTFSNLDVNNSVFDPKAIGYQVEHLDTNIGTSMEFFEGILSKGYVDGITFPDIALLPVYAGKSGGKKSTRVQLDKDLGYKLGSKETKIEKIKELRQNIYYPNVLASKGADVSISPLESRFSAMISAKDSRLKAGEKIDLATAKNLAAKRKKRFDIVAPGANDFDGLMYTILADGKLGEEQYEWIKDNLYKPYSIATYRLNNTRQDAAIRFKKLKKENRELFKKLSEDSGFGGFTYEQALRVWLFQKAGHSPSGLDEDTQSRLVKIIKKNKDIEQLGKDLSNILPIKEFWVEPDANNWQVESIKKDVIDAIETVARKQFLTEWKNNSDQIFSKNNMNKLLAAFGEDYVEALKDMLYRMETGNSRPEGSNARMNKFMNWVRGSVATTMFFNRRSAVLQQISNVNFLNWGDNNPIAAAKAFANLDQYSKDFLFILNSNYLKERRGGLKTDVNAADLAEAIRRGGYSGFLARLLQAGFSLTQYGDSFAIATGGATFYRNRINTYLKQGKTQEEAEQQAFLDFQEVSEETQQSARPDRLSQEQTNILGRVFLAFQNTPMQMTRLAVKAGKDLIARRGDPKEKIFKMAYYGVAQSIIFSALQTALIGDMFSYGDDDDEDDEKQKLKNTKTKRLVNNVVDSFLKGTGIYGVFVTTAKNAALKFYEQEQRKEEKKRPDYAYVMIEALNVSPPIGIKARNFYGALKNYEYNARYIEDIGYDLNNPALDIGSSAVESMFNIPAHSVLSTIRDIDAMTQENVDTWHRIALGLGWHTWDLGLENEDLNEMKSEIKERNKQIRSSKKQKNSSDSLKKEYFKREKIK